MFHNSCGLFDHLWVDQSLVSQLRTMFSLINTTRGNCGLFSSLINEENLYMNRWARVVLSRFSQKRKDLCIGHISGFFNAKLFRVESKSLIKFL